MAHSLFNLTRTASIAIKKHPNGSKSNKLQIDRGVASNGGGRRHTMLPQRQQTRDSVLSNGSSDRSSSVSDETFITHPALQEPGGPGFGNDLFGYDADEQIREAWPLKCCFVVKEIMQTEIAYVQSLADIIKGYLTPLYSHLLNSGESPNFIKTVFSNIVKIHQIHQELLEDFQDNFTSPQDFGSAFLHVDFLSLYTVYCTSYSQGNECLERALHENEELRSFIEQCQRVLGHSLPLSSQLIKPVQRILKYRLLLEELNKHFDIQHPACDTIQAALTKMATVAEQINTSFSSQKRSSKGVPSAVAKKRTNQIRDLQISRSSNKGRWSGSPNTSPLHSNLYPRSSSETHLNHIHRAHTHGHTLPNGSVAWPTPAPVPNTGSRGTTHTLPQRRNTEEGRRGLVDSLPSVQRLKSYFENLTKEGEEETRRESIGQRTHSGGMRKARSMAGTKRDSISTVGLGSPNKSPSWSPNWSPTKSPIKVPVLPKTMSSPFTKFPSPSPPKSPSKPPRGSPTKVTIVAPSGPSHSPPKARRRSSCGNTSDFKTNTEGGGGGVRGYIRKTQREDRVVTTQFSGPTFNQMGNQTAKTAAAGKISEEIKRQLAAMVLQGKRGQVPRTMV